ncbi:MAG: HNH endonuclease [Candidatus Colwellbacteria bacterium]|nr:HNH endonuclease [Candidatus Colwellbacteria bacterium]
MSDYVEIIFEEEQWKEILGMTRYEISNFGRIKIKKTSMIMKQRIIGDYMGVKITTDLKVRKNIQIHVCVAKYFVENADPKKYKVVDHIDNNKLNNDYTNLRWIDQSGNMINHHQFREYKGREIIQYDKDMDVVKEWKDIKEIVEQTEYNYFPLMNAISANISYKTFIWKYKIEIVDKEIVNEEWKDIITIGEHSFIIYQISSHGRLRNKTRNKILSPSIISGYYHINLSSEKSVLCSLYVHRIVAELFVSGKSDINKIVNHLDGNRLNNHYTNLEWTTIKGNTVHAVGRKVNQIDIVSREVINTFDTITDAYKSFGKPCNSHISRCCKGTGSYTLGYDWEYADD